MVITACYGVFELGRRQEVDVHRLVQRALLDKVLADGAGGTAEWQGETGGLVVLDVIQCGVGARQADEFLQEEA